MSLCNTARAIDVLRVRPKRRYRKRVLIDPREPRVSAKLRKLREKFALLEWFVRLDDPLSIHGVEAAGRDRIVRTSVGNFRVNRKGHITGPFKGEPLTLSSAAIVYTCGPDGEWSGVARRYNCASIAVGHKWSVRLTRIKKARKRLTS